MTGKQQALRLALVVALLIAAAWPVMQTLRLLRHGPQPPAANGAGAPPTAGPGAGLLRAPPALTEPAIRQWTLFGPALSSNRQQEATKPPRQRLEVRVVGIFYNRAGTLSGAIVLAPPASTEASPATGANQKLVHIGGNIADGVTLKAVRRHSVLVERHGWLQTLPIVPLRETDQPPPEDNDMLAALQQQAQNPDQAEHRAALKKMGLESVQPGTPNGYRVTDDAKDLKKQYGLQTGDVIRSINGYGLGTLTNDRLAIRSFRTSGMANIIIQRGGKTLRYHYRASQQSD